MPQKSSMAVNGRGGITISDTYYHILLSILSGILTSESDEDIVVGYERL